jgi:ADP-ribosyl-[dinitrogen reductase] hydrolase
MLYVYDRNTMSEAHIIGCLLGTAAGDSIGLPCEGLSRQRAARLFGPPDRQRLFFGRGMVSDDTEHTCLAAQSLITSHGDVELFRRDLARRLRFWLLGLPGGTGLATARAILKLWIGFRPQTSGVFSAGNGPAMRAAILGAAIDDRQHLRELVRASTRLTHTDPKAEYGAEATSGEAFLDELSRSLGDDGEELTALVARAVTSVQQGESTLAFADALGLHRGVTGYVDHTVPVVIHAWLSHPHDFRAAVRVVIDCGGDTDTTAAIVGGIVGTTVGRNGIPSAWLDGLLEWPRTVDWMARLGAQLATGIELRENFPQQRLSIFALLPRNLFFLAVVLFHGFRRLFPPY